MKKFSIYTLVESNNNDPSSSSSSSSSSYHELGQQMTCFGPMTVSDNNV